MAQSGTLGRTGLPTGSLGLGGAGFLMDLHRRTSEEECASILRQAREIGVVYFDTAPLYRGSEARLGAGLGDDRDAVIATKVGAYEGEPMVVDFSPTTIRRTVEASRQRLRRDRLDLVQVHELTRETWDSVFESGGALSVLQKLQAADVIGSIGVTGSDAAVLVDAVETDQFDMVQIWRRWNLLDRSAEPVLDAAASRGLGVVIGTPLASGALTGSAGNTYFYDPPPAHVMATIDALQETAARSGVSLAACALQFLIRDERVSVPITGVDSAEQLEQNLRDISTPVSDDVLDEVAALAAREVAAWPAPS